MTKAFFRARQFLAYMSKIPATEMFQFAPFEQIPDLLLRIEIRRVARQALQMQTLAFFGSEKLLDHLCPMERRTIPGDSSNGGKVIACQLDTQYRRLAPRCTERVVRWHGETASRRWLRVPYRDPRRPHLSFGAANGPAVESPEALVYVHLYVSVLAVLAILVTSVLLSLVGFSLAWRTRGALTPIVVRGLQLAPLLAATLIGLAALFLFPLPYAP